MKTKKIISAMLAVSLISAATVAVNAADATGNVDLSVENTTAKAGEEVIINVNANIPDTGVAGCEFAITYDADFLTIKSIKEGNLSGTGASAEELAKNAELADTMVSGSDYSCLDYSIHSDKGEVDVMWCTGLEDQKYWLKGEGQFITIVATVNPDATGSSEVGIAPISRDSSAEMLFGYVDYSSNTEYTYSVNATAGTITVGEVEVTTSVTEDKPVETTTTSGSAGGNTFGEPSMLGDTNCDGIVDLLDLTVLNQHVVKISTLEGVALANANVIADDEIGISDLAQLKKFLIKVIDKF